MDHTQEPSADTSRFLLALMAAGAIIMSAATGHMAGATNAAARLTTEMGLPRMIVTGLAFVVLAGATMTMMDFVCRRLVQRLAHFGLVAAVFVAFVVPAAAARTAGLCAAGDATACIRWV